MGESSYILKFGHFLSPTMFPVVQRTYGGRKKAGSATPGSVLKPRPPSSCNIMGTNQSPSSPSGDNSAFSPIKPIKHSTSFSSTTEVGDAATAGGGSSRTPFRPLTNLLSTVNESGSSQEGGCGSGDVPTRRAKRGMPGTPREEPPASSTKSTRLFSPVVSSKPPHHIIRSKRTASHEAFIIIIIKSPLPIPLCPCIGNEEKNRAKSRWCQFSASGHAI